MGDKTTVEVNKPTRKRLRVWKAERGMTYDEAINTLLDEYELEQQDTGEDA